MASNVSTTAVAAAGFAAVLVYSGVKGVSAVSGLRTILGGHAPVVDAAEGPDPLGASAAGAPPIGPVSGRGAELAAAAAAYIGSGSTYRWGGSMPNGWDCSGFVNRVANQLGLPIPGVAAGRAFTGHGPVTAQWGLLPLSYLATVSAADIQAGDLIIWPGRHMGIALNATQMVGCPGPNGTPAPVLQPVHEARPVPMVVRRYRTAVDLTGIS